MNASYQVAAYDFRIGTNDTVYILDTSMKQFYKFVQNSSSLTEVGGPGSSSIYQLLRIFVDSSRAIYTYESYVCILLTYPPLIDIRSCALFNLVFIFRERFGLSSPEV